MISVSYFLLNLFLLRFQFRYSLAISSHALFHYFLSPVVDILSRILIGLHIPYVGVIHPFKTTVKTVTQQPTIAPIIQKIKPMISFTPGLPAVI